MSDIIEPDESNQDSTLPLPESSPTHSVMYTVVMYGGSRAGKTSLLARMHSDAKGVISDAGLRLTTTSHKARARLAVALEALDGMALEVLKAARDADERRVNARGVPATLTNEVNVYDFEIGRSTKTKPIGILRFVDLSGEDLQFSAPVVREWIDAADMLLVCINTPAMMESATGDPRHDEAWASVHRQRNGLDITSLVIERAGQGNAPDSVLLVPIKCERWLAEEPGGATLHAAISARYRPLLAALETPGLARTSAGILPVITVGNVHFREFAVLEPRAGISAHNVEEIWQVPEDGTATTPRHYSEPFRWALHAFVTRIDEMTLVKAISDDPDSTLPENLAAELQELFNDATDSLIESRIGKILRLKRADFVIDGIKTWVEETTGFSEFEAAADNLWAARERKPPFHVIREVSRG
jgi:hypothetical protein